MVKEIKIVKIDRKWWIRKNGGVGKRVSKKFKERWKKDDKYGKKLRKMKGWWKRGDDGVGEKDGEKFTMWWCKMP